MTHKKHLFIIFALCTSLSSLNSMPAYLHYLPALGATISTVPSLAKSLYLLERLRLSDQSAHQEKIAFLQEIIARHTHRAVRVVMVSDSALNNVGVGLAAAYYSALHHEYCMFFSLELYKLALQSNNKAVVEFFVAHELNHFNNHDVQIVPLTHLLIPTLTWLATYYAPGAWKFGAGIGAAYIGTLWGMWYRHTAEKRADNQVPHDPVVLQAARAAFENMHTAEKKVQPLDELLWLQHFLKGHVDNKTRIEQIDARLAQPVVAA